MLSLAMLLGLAAAPPQQEEPQDLFEWARKLDSLDLTWSWGDFAFEVEGQLDFEVFAFNDEAPGVQVEDSALRSDRYDRTDTVSSPETAFRLQVFLDGFYRDWLEWSVEGRLDGSSADDGNVGARFEQAWMRLKLDPAAKVQAGKFEAPIGNLIPRHASRKNPLTTWPLPYDQPVTLADLGNPPGLLVRRRDLPDVKDWYVPIWQAVYGWGVQFSGEVGDLGYAAAVTNSAPATLPEEWDSEVGDLDFANFYLHASYALHLTTKVGATWSRGPYAREDSVDLLAGGAVARAGGKAEEFPQTLVGLDLEFTTGHWELFAELFWTRLENPGTEDLELWTGYVEGKYTFSPGLFGAARLARMSFGEVEDAQGGSHAWDRDLDRVEFGGGYFFTKNLLLKATAQLNYTMGGREPNDHLFMMQLGLGF